MEIFYTDKRNANSMLKYDRRLVLPYLLLSFWLRYRGGIGPPRNYFYRLHTLKQSILSREESYTTKSDSQISMETSTQKRENEQHIQYDQKLEIPYLLLQYWLLYRGGVGPSRYYYYRLHTLKRSILSKEESHTTRSGRINIQILSLQ